VIEKLRDEGTRLDSESSVKMDNPLSARSEQNTLRHIYNSIMKQEANLLRSFKAARESRDELESYVRRLEGEKASIQEELATLRATGLNQALSGHQSGLDDCTIRFELRSSLSVAIANWSKTYSRTNFDELNRDATSFLDWVILNVSCRSMSSQFLATEKGVLPRTIVRSYIMDLFCDDIYCNPFIGITVCDMDTPGVVDHKNTNRLLKFYSDFKNGEFDLAFSQRLY
jgi:hypothetical protein